MSRIVKFAVPTMVACALIGVTAIALVDSKAEQRKYPERALSLADGTKAVQTFDGRNVKVHVPQARGAMPLKDGDYKLTNGGAFKVQGGRVVWDAFGVIEKLRKGGLTHIPDPIG